MKRGKVWILSLIFLLVVGGYGWWYVFGGSLDRDSVGTFSAFSPPPTSVVYSPPSGSASPGYSMPFNAEYQLLKTYTVERVITGLEVPWSLVFTSENRWLVTERLGKVTAIIDGVAQAKPLLTLSDISSESEEGLMGMALDPEYAKNSFVYLSYAYKKDNELAVKVVRYKDAGTQLIEPKILLEGIPAAQYHAGSRLRFSPDGKLFVTTGDASKKELAQDMDSLAGKILRMEKDGSIPTSNPNPNSYIYSSGHRNPQGIDFHPITWQLVSTEHGPSVFDGPAGGDEVNFIMPGENYGWPLVSHEKNSEGLIPPLLVFTPAIAPASGVFYTGTLMPELQYSFLFGGLRGEGLFRVWFNPQDPWKTVRYDKFPEVEVGRVRDVANGPYGAIYFTTSNLDGRGQPNEGDDSIYRLIPKETP